MTIEQQQERQQAGPNDHKWLETYYTCGCSLVAKTQKELLGYCEKHGHNWRNRYKVPADMPSGFAG